MLAVVGCSSEIQHAAKTTRNAPELTLAREPAELAGLEFPDGRHLDLGDGWEKTTVECSYRIKNVSDEAIKFRKAVSTTCGCTAGELSSEELAPGETCTLKVSLVLPDVAGEKKRYMATVHRQPADGPIRNIAFTADLTTKAAWFTIPADFTWRLTEDELKSFELGILGCRDRSTKILDVSTNLPNTTLTFAKTELDPLEPVVVHGQATEDLPAGRYEIVIKTDEPLRPERKVSVTVARDAAFRVMPGSVFLRKVKDTEHHFARMVVIRPNSAGPVECSVIDGLTYSIGEDQEYNDSQKMCVVELILDKAVADFSNADLVVSTQTSDGVRQECRVPTRIAE